MVFGVLALVHVSSVFLYRSPWPLSFAFLFALPAVWIGTRHQEQEATLSPEALETARGLYDLSHRHAFSWLFFTFVAASWIIFSSLSLSVNNSKPQEFVEFVQSNVTFLSLLVIGLGTSLIVAHNTQTFGEEGWERRYFKYLLMVSLFSLLYWIVALTLFGTFNTASFFTFCIAAVLYLLLALAFTVCLRGKILYRNFALHPVRLVTSLAIIALLAVSVILQRDVWLTQPYINRTPNLYDKPVPVDYDEETGVYTLTNPGGDFHILQLTDIHLGGSYSSFPNDIKALKACFALIEETRPDLVVVTGDLCFPMGLASFSLNNTAPVMQFAAFMRNIGIPWAFTYGNHDTEAMAATDAQTLDDLYRSLSYRTSKNLLYPYVQPPVTGRNNQLILIRNPDETLNTALFLIDSNAYTGNGFNEYDFIHDDQVDWYTAQIRRLNAEEGHTISSMAFFHIPLQQYKTAYELYTAGSDEVTYFFGSNDEKMFDKVCCSTYPSQLFDVMKELGSTTATFCGHDHYNNISLEYQGIRLTYGMSIDYLVMPGIATDTKQRGGTLITLHPDSSYEIVQIPLNSLSVASS